MANFNFSQIFIKDAKLPLVIQPQSKKQANYSDLIQFLREENPLFKEQLLNYGAILFRGFNVSSAEQFSEVISASSLGAIFNYDLCAVPRSKIQEGIYTSVNCHESYCIPMHNEKSYDPEFPSHIFFNCLHAAETGGITPLADAHQVWLSLPQFMQEKLRAKGIKYSRYYYGKSLRQKLVKAIGSNFSGRTWMSGFQTENKHELEQILNKTGRKGVWTSKGNGLIVEVILPAFRYHPITNKIVWFNQSDHNNHSYNGYFSVINQTIKNPIVRFILSQKSFLPYVASYGDGEPISKKEADIMHFAIQKNKVSTPWQQGDLMVIDNYSCMHGKEPHTGKRLLLAGMTA